MMKAVAYYDLPVDGEELERLVAKAREQGLPVLAVVFEQVGFEEHGINGLTIAQSEAMALGFAMSEMEHELNTLGSTRLRKLSARVLSDEDELASA